LNRLGAWPFGSANPRALGVRIGAIGVEEDEDFDGNREQDAFHEPEFALILVACLIGIGTGASVVLFNDAVKYIRQVLWDDTTVVTGRQLLSHLPESVLVPQLLLPPLLGSILVGLITAASGGSSTAGSGSDGQVKNSSHIVVKKLARIVNAIISLGTGISLGPEGPSVELGKDVAQAAGNLLKSNGRRYLAPLLAAGSGSGVAAGFNAPVSGVFFAVETVLQNRRTTSVSGSSGLTVAMVLLASVLAAVVSQAGLGSSPAFRVPDYRLESLLELPLYLLFGSICGFVSSSFSYSLKITSQAFEQLKGQEEEPNVKMVLLPVIGGLTTGVLALGYPEILYQGFDNVNAVLSSSSGSDYSVSILIQIVILKIIATSVCRGSGLQGGIYAPSIFIGASLGSAFGLACNILAEPLDLAVSPPQAYALVGVGAMLASTCEVPLTSILLLFELTRDYLIILPTLAAVGISFWVSSYWKSITEEKTMKKTGEIYNADIVQEFGDTIIVMDQGLTVDQIIVLLTKFKKKKAIIKSRGNEIHCSLETSDPLEN
jgi:H+/Cl- antiporter ClcA